MGDLDTQMGMEAQEILDNCAHWTEKIYDKTDEEIENYLNSQGMDCNRIFYIEYSYIQIGKTEKWLREISAKIQDPLTVRREILLQRLHGSSLSPFPQEDIEYIVQNEQKPIDELWLLEYYKFDIYTTLNKKLPYLVGVDCASGTGGDHNAITVIDPRTVKPVAEFESSYIGETDYENLIKALVKHLPRACIVVERNSMGDGIVDHLLHSEVAGKLYFDKAKDLVEEEIKSNETAESMLKKQSTIKRFYGVYTGTRTRSDMFEILGRHVNEFKENFVTHNVIRDLSRLIRKSSGRIEAGPGFHDDSIMSYLIAMYVYYHGNNLALFGITRGAQEEELDNSGLPTYAELDPNLVSPQVIEEIKTVEEREKKTEELDWDNMMREAIARSQKETRELYKNKQINHGLYDNTPEGVGTDDYDDNGEIPLDFFSEINNM
jgi:hypothetical protein